MKDNVEREDLARMVYFDDFVHLVVHHNDMPEDKRMREEMVIYNLLSERYHELLDNKLRDEKVFSLIKDMYEDYKRRVLQGPETTDAWRSQFIALVAKYKQTQLETFRLKDQQTGWGYSFNVDKAKAQLELDCAELIANFNYALDGRLP